MVDLDLPVPVASSVASPAAPYTVDWLRGSVARFSEGPAHERRRALAVALLAEGDPDAARAAARLATVAALRSCPAGPVDLMSAVAWRVPVGVLAGTRENVAEAVGVVARAYPPGATGGAAADRAVADLVAVLGPMSPDEEVAARIGVLVQACAATAGLIGGAAALMLRAGLSPDGAVAALLRDDPPVRSTTRIRAGSPVVVSLADAPFGAGRHACPGSALAVAIACGALDGLVSWRLVSSALVYEPSAHLRIPASLLVCAA